MAKRSKRKSMKKIEPAVGSLYYKTDTFSGDRAITFDIFRDLSVVNRRFYRQGMHLAIESVEILTPGGITGAASVTRIPMTWVSTEGYKKAFRAWQRMNRESLEMAESVRPRFLDFKIFMDTVHHGSQLPTDPNYVQTMELIPRVVGSAGTPEAVMGEWTYSKVYIPQAYNNTQPAGTDNMVPTNLIAVGPSWPGVGVTGEDAVSIIEGYAASRALPYAEDPNAPSDADDVSGPTPENWISAIFNEGETQDAAVLDDMIGENNQAPYPYEGDGIQTDTHYPGGANQLNGLELVDIGYISGTTIGGKTRLKGGVFPSGLMRLNLSINASSAVVIKINLIHGGHRGYLAESNLEA